MSMAKSLQFDVTRNRQGDGFEVSAPVEASENCGTCIWGTVGCLEGMCRRKASGCKAEPKPNPRPAPLPIPKVEELQMRHAQANEVLLRNLANRKAALIPSPKTLEGSTPLIHARRRVVQAVLKLSHFETRFGQGGDQLKDRKADLELAMIQWEQELLKSFKG